MLPYFKIGYPKYCVYCGDIASETDHVIPISFHSTQANPSGRDTSFGPVAHCCSPCNRMLFNFGFDTFEQRCKFVSDKISDQTKAVIWTEAEMNQLDISLRDFVKKEQAKRLWYRWRSDWFQSRDYLLNLEGLLLETCLDKTHEVFDQSAFNYFQPTLIWVRTLYGKD